MASTITDLPAELIEAMIIYAASDNPDSIAALSQTSKLFYDIIYQCPDQHLWREILLTTFDDPRPVLNYLSTISGGHPSFDAQKFDWKHEYVRRISAARYIKHSPHVRKGITHPKAGITMHPASFLQEDTPSLLSIVRALLSAIQTSTPFPSSPISLTILTNPTSSQEEANSPFAPMINSPPFPPLLLLIANCRTVLHSINATWLQGLLDIGFPPQLTRILFGTLSIDVQGRPLHHPALTPASNWDGSEVSHLFHKLVCCTGFVPISTPPPLVKMEAESTSATKNEEAEYPIYPLIVPPSQSLFFSAKEQCADARILARRRVYDMRYLSPARLWGPFQSVRSRDPNAGTSSHRGQDEDDDDEDEDEEDEDEEDLRLTYWLNRRPQPNPPIVPYELVPDYVWLASARIVVEANLREVFEQSEDPNALSMGGVLPHMRQMHTTRMGGSPEFWNGWINQSGNVNDDEEVSKMSENSETEEGEGVKGWDWAGVSGIWKRCVCWLDYRELLIRNRAPKSFVDDSIQEACRVIPMIIRITGYSQSTIPPDSSTRPLPTIHVEGESIGSDRSLRDVRKIKGTVGMIGDGAIRWSLVTSAPGSSEPEWSSEAVQIGGPGAAIGVLGMWTGAQHEGPDPLGPFWAWKVT